MRKEQYGLKALKIVYNVLIIAVLLIILLQFNDIQRRLISIESGNVTFSESQNKSPTKSSELNFGISKDRKWLNPKLPNLIKNVPLFVVPKDSNYNSQITAHAKGEEKSYNQLIENSAQVQEYYGYVACAFATKGWDNIEEWVGDLAERAELLDDERTYIIYLKKGVKWHTPLVDFSNPKYEWLKGERFVTAHDVKFTFDTIMNPQVEAGSLRNYYEDVESVDVIDDYTVSFKWSKKIFTSKTFTLGFGPIPEFIYAYDESGIRYPKETFGLKFNDHWYNDRMIGCGPYTLKERVPNIHTILERNEDYFIGQRPVPKTIKYEIVKDDNLAMLKLSSNELSVLPLINESVYRDEILAKNPNSDFINGELNYKIYPRLVYYYIGWNMEHPIFRDKKVRQAMTYAFNRQKVLDSVLAGLGELISGPIPPTFPEYDKNIKPYPFDLEKSKQLLLEAGWKDIDGDGILEKEIDGKIQKFEFTIVFISFPMYKTMYSMFKEDLIKIGVKMNLSIVDWAVYQKKLDDKDFDAHHGVWGLSTEPDLYQIWHSSQALVPRGSNRVSFKNEEADKIIEEIRVTFDQKKRIKLFHQFNKIVHDEQPYTFTCTRDGVAGYQSFITNFITLIQRPHVQYFTLSSEK